MFTTFSATRTREEWYQYVMRNIIEEDPILSDLRNYFKNINVTTFDQFLNFTTGDLFEPWKLANGTSTRELAFTAKQVVHMFQSFYTTTCIKDNTNVDPTTLTGDAFYTFTLGSYNGGM